MIYTAQITISKNTAYGSRASTNIGCGVGVIHKIDIVLPPGCEQLVHVALYEGGHPFAPTNEGMSFTGDGEVISFPEFYEFKDVPHIVTVWTWNTDECYNHTILVRIYMLPKWLLIPYRVANVIIEGIQSLFR